jgi:hypothetical protein
MPRATIVSPSPPAASSSAASMSSTSICGSIVTPARWASCASWRRVGSWVPQLASDRISGASARPAMVIGRRTRRGSALA